VIVQPFAAESRSFAKMPREDHCPPVNAKFSSIG